MQNLIETELRRRLAPLGIHPRQACFLEAMDRTGLVSQADLALAFGVTSASMSTITDRLVAAGCISRAIDPASRRQNVLELTDKGRTLLAGIGEAWAAVDHTIRDVLGRDAATFFDLARRLRDGLDGTVLGIRKKSRARGCKRDLVVRRVHTQKTTGKVSFGHGRECWKAAHPIRTGTLARGDLEDVILGDPARTRNSRRLRSTSS